MFGKFLCLAALAVCALGFSGCGTVKIIDNGQSRITPSMQTRAAEMKKEVTSDCREFGVFITAATQDCYKKFPERLATRCSMFGITDVYIDIDNQKLADDEIYAALMRNFVACFNANRIRPWLVLKDSALYSRPDPSWTDKLFPSLSSDNNSVYGKVKNITAFNDGGASRLDKIAGIIMMVNPDKLTSGAECAPNDLIYSWHEAKYGKNNDNDMLIKQSFELIGAVKKYAGSLPVVLMVEHFIHDKAAAGALSMGRINDFIKLGSHVIIADFTAKPKVIKTQAEAELQAAAKPAGVVICVRVDADAVSGTASERAINTKDWKYMLRVLKYLVRNAGKFRSFRGIALDDYAGLERSWETGN